MKRNGNKIAALWMLTLLLAGMPICAQEQPPKEILLRLPISDVPSDGLYYSEDSIGHTYGPQDFAVADGKVYILDSNHQCVHVYENGVWTEARAVGEKIPFVTNLAADGGYVYILDNMQRMYRWTGDGWELLANFYGLNVSEAILDFYVRDGKAYVTMPDDTGIRTWIWEIGTELSDAAFVPGHLLGGELHYETMYLRGDEAGMMSSRCVVTVTYPDGTARMFRATSSKGLGGASLLGMDDAGRLYFQVTEVWSEEDFRFQARDTLHVLDVDGETLSVTEVPDMVKNIDSQIKWLDGRLFQLNTFEKRLEVVDLTALLFPPVSDAHGLTPFTINYEIAPDMFINVEWVVSMTVQDCADHGIDISAVRYFLDAIEAMPEIDAHFAELYDKLTTLYNSMKDS